MSARGLKEALQRWSASTTYGDGDLCDLVLLVRSEYLEMPGLALTEAQARRLWNLDPPLCEAVLSRLVGTGFLTRTDDSRYVLLSRSAA